MDTALALTNIIFLIGLLVYLILLGFNILKVLNRKYDINEKKLYRELYDSFENINDIFDNYIVGELQEYKLYNEDIFSDYITYTTQRKIIRDVTKMCMEDISPVLQSQLSLIYKNERLDSLLIRKVTIAVIAEIVTVNSNIVPNNDILKK